MTYTPNPTWVDGVSALTAAHVQKWDDGLVDHETRVTTLETNRIVPKGVRAYAASTGQTVVTTAAAAVLDLNTLDYNEDATLFTVDLTGDKITVLQGGLFLATWDVDFADSTGGTREAYLTKNGGSTLFACASGSGGRAGRIAPLRLVANDYVQVKVYVTGAGNVALTSTTSDQCGLALHRIGY